MDSLIFILILSMN